MSAIKLEIPHPITLIKTLQIDKSSTSPSPLNDDHNNLNALISSSSASTLNNLNSINSLNLIKNQYQIILNRLKPYTDYTLIIQAYNGIGAGPRSDEIRFKTDQSTPSAAPSITKCTSPNSRTLQLTWTKLNADKLNGELAGYKIHYYTFDEQQQQQTKSITEENSIIVDGNQNLINNIFNQQSSDLNEINQQHHKYDQLINLSMIDRLPVRRTEHIPADQNETQLSNLNKFTNYTISVNAFTKAGDGPLSEFILCQTIEDIPDSPAAVKVIQTSSDSFYITWIAPKKTNGQLKSFTIYRKQIDQNEDGDEDELINEKDITISSSSSKTTKLITTHPNNLYSFTVPKHVNYHRTSQLNSGSTYEFWITVTNSIGESEPSTRIRKTLSKNGCAAEIINFNTVYNVYVGDTLEIPCKSAGQPKPESEWLFNGNSLRNSHQQQQQSAAKTNLIHEHFSPNEQIFSTFIHLTNIQNADQGNYTCHSFNVHGHSYITYQVHVRDLDTLDQLEYDDLDEDTNRALTDQTASNQLTTATSISIQSNSTFSSITSPLIRLIKNNYDHIIIQWKVKNPFLLNSILAYELFYRQVNSGTIDTNIEWKQFRLRNTLLDEQQQPTSSQITPNTENQILNKQQSKTKLKRNKQITINGLNCGTNYQIYMILDTVFGKSTPSNILNTKTLGREPIASNVGLFFSKLNSSTVKLNLDKVSFNFKIFKALFLYIFIFF